jgi:hypothetical protein
MPPPKNGSATGPAQVFQHVVGKRVPHAHGPVTIRPCSRQVPPHSPAQAPATGTAKARVKAKWAAGDRGGAWSGDSRALPGRAGGSSDGGPAAGRCALARAQWLLRLTAGTATCTQRRFRICLGWTPLGTASFRCARSCRTSLCLLSLSAVRWTKCCRGSTSQTRKLQYREPSPGVELIPAALMKAPGPGTAASYLQGSATVGRGCQ